MVDFAWDPASYPALMAAEVPDYLRLQNELVAVVANREVERGG